MCLPSHTAPHLNFTITYKRSVEFQMEIKIVCRRGFGDFTLLFCIGRLRNVQTHVLSYCSAHYIDVVICLRSLL